MNRRGFLKLIGAAGVTAGGIAVLGDELWEPGKKTIVLPPAGGWNIAAHRQSGLLDHMVQEHRRGQYVLQDTNYRVLATFDPRAHASIGLNQWIQSELGKMRDRPTRYIVATV